MTELELTRTPDDRRLYSLDGIGTVRLEGLFSNARPPRLLAAGNGGERRDGRGGRRIHATRHPARRQAALGQSRADAAPSQPAARALRAQRGRSRPRRSRRQGLGPTAGQDHPRENPRRSNRGCCSSQPSSFTGSPSTPPTRRRQARQPLGRARQADGLWSGLLLADRRGGDGCSSGFRAPDGVQLALGGRVRDPAARDSPSGTKRRTLNGKEGFHNGGTAHAASKIPPAGQRRVNKQLRIGPSHPGPIRLNNAVPPASARSCPPAAIHSQSQGRTFESFTAHYPPLERAALRRRRPHAPTGLGFR